MTLTLTRYVPWFTRFTQRQYAGQGRSQLLQLVEQAARQAAAGTLERPLYSWTASSAHSDHTAKRSQRTHPGLPQQQLPPICSAGALQGSSLQDTSWQQGISETSSRSASSNSIFTPIDVSTTPNSWSNSAQSAGFASSRSSCSPRDVLTAPSSAASPASGASYTSSSPSLRRTSSAIANYQAVGLPSFQDLLQSYRKNLGSVTTAVGRLTQVGH